MIQLVSPNLGQTSYAGWCLYFARSAFGAPAVEASAWGGWLNAKFKHADRNFPGLYVPVWFQHYGIYDDSGIVKNWGHVGILYPDGRVLSSPITFNGPGSQLFKSIDELVNTINRILPNSRTAFVGWTDDISNVRVVSPQAEEQQMIIQNADNWRGRAQRSFQAIRGRDMGSGEFEPFIGQDFLHLIEALEDNPETDAHIDYANWGKRAKSENWEGQIADLKAKLVASQAETAEAKVSSGSFTAADRTLLKTISDGVAFLVSKITGIFK